MNRYEYNIGGIKYIQRKLVLSQVKDLFEALETVEIPKTSNMFAIIKAIGDKLPLILSIILTPTGVRIEDKNQEEIAEALKTNLEMDKAVEVIEDFFALNRISLLLEKIQGISGHLNKQ